jgi:hypothetical protein
VSTRIYRACDACQDEGVDAPGTQRGPLFGRTIDLCDGHWDTMAKALAELVDRVGVPVPVGETPVRKRRKGPVTAAQPEVAPTLTDGVPCPLCGFPREDTKALGNHLRGKHGLNVVDVYGMTCALCGDPFDSGQAIGLHVTRGHGVSGGMAAAFAQAEAAGDPHGVVAARRAAWAGM